MFERDTRMRKQRIDGQETRQRLLEAACMVFAEKGFWETTNADICEKAKVNIAGVNYHFGGKEELYVKAWKYSFDKSLEDHPPDGGIPSEAPAQERLRGRILSFMQRIADPKTYELEMIHKEMACPTGFLHDVMPSAMETLREGFDLIIGELLGGEASEQQLRYCYMNVMDMCFGLVHHIHRSKMSTGVRSPGQFFPELDVESFADHVTRFSLAGIRSIREEGKRKCNNIEEEHKNENDSPRE
jgi:AcrR family transcriptional regulator